MIKPAPNPRFSAGFTLVEVMMAATILVVCFIGLIQAVTLSSGMMDNARRQTVAAQIINHEIEKLRLKNWTTISGLPTTSTTITIDPQFADAVAACGATFTLNRTVADVVSGSLREVTFTLTWVVATSRSDGAAHPLTFTYTRINSAYFGKYGLNTTYQRS